MSQERAFHLGRYVDPATLEPTDEQVQYEPDDLTTHGVIVGMTGSGKTGLAVVLLEEALRAGVPALILDPKGDMPNLLLNFPDFRAEDFRPWVNDGEARDAGLEPEAFAAQQAETWREGLTRDGIDSAAMRSLLDAVDFAVYTPGSTAGIPVNIVGDLRAPATDDAEVLREEAAAFVSGLLSLVGIDADPLASREHILLANIIEASWSAGRDLDLAGLIAQTADPPFRKLGVFEVESFYPAKDRQALAMRLNALIASPSFAAWTEGPPLDIEAMLGGREDGRTPASILYLAHLSDAERQFVVTLVLSRVITWMRSQPGTGSLRALLYMDEVYGFAPPTAEPPSKRPILTLLKQARAFGVGFLLATQNPVDLDYKAMSNAGTWMIGRLQTERDKARVLEALSSASGDVDTGEVDRLVSHLGKRQFVLHNTHERGGPRLFTTRWAMSYLRGPLTRDQLEALPDEAVRPPARDAEPSAATPEPAALAADESPVAPQVAAGVPVYYIDPAAPWASALGAAAGSKRFAPAIVARVHARFDERVAELDHTEEWELVLYPLEGTPSADEAAEVDYDPRDLRREAPDAATYRLPGAPLDDASLFRDLERDIRDSLVRRRTMTVWRNGHLKLYSRPGESREAFEERCLAAAREAADRDAATLREKFERQMDRVRQAIATAEDRVEQLKTDTSSRRTHEVVSVVGDLLGAFLGGRRSAGSIASRASRTVRGASSRRTTTMRTTQRLENARERLGDRVEELEALEQDLQDDLADLVDDWEAKAREIEEIEVGLEKSDVDVDEVALAWLPVA